MRTTITLQVDRDTLDRLDAEAHRLDASRSYAARRLLAQALDRELAITGDRAPDDHLTDTKGA